MARVLMCGPLTQSGGVSIHTKCLSKFLSALNVKIIIFNLANKNTENFDGSSAIKIYQRTFGLILKSIKERKNYDIIHIQISGGIFSFITAVTSSLLSKICNKKSVITFHYRSSQQFVNKYKYLFAFVLRNSHAFIVVSEKQKMIIQGTFPKLSNKVVAISNGFDVNKFMPMDIEICREKLNLPKDKKIIVSVGNLFKVKGYYYLVETVDEIIKSDKDIFCIIVGSGPLKEKIKWRIETQNLERYIYVAGRKSHDEIPIWINACNVFVLPSLAEGNPTVMLECLGCGKPFVGTKVGGVPEIITSEDYGFLVEPANPKELAEKIVVALEKKWDENKIKKYSEKFSWGDIAKETLKIYENISSNMKSKKP